MPHMTYLHKTKHFMDMSVATKINFLASDTFMGSHKDFYMSTTHFSYKSWHTWRVMNLVMQFNKLEAKCKIQQEQEQQEQEEEEEEQSDS